MAKTLLIIGAGAEQIPAYQSAHARGLTVIGSDMNPDAPAFAHADHRLLASTRDPQQTLDAVAALAGRLRIDGVMTIANDVPYTVAVVAESLGLPGIAVDSARLVSNKLLMKQAFQRHGVACPWFASVDSPAQLATLMAEAGYDRYVIKPVDGRGARGVLQVDRNSDLAWAFAESRRWGESGALIVEAFIPGLQLSTESFLLGGRCFTAGIAERNYEFLDRFSPYIIENGGTIPAPLSDDLRHRIDRLLEAGAAALGVTEGVVKGDLIITPDGEPVIVELALRLSGGWFATHQIPAASGVSLVDAVISHALGEPVDAAALTPTRSRATAVRYWFPPAGTIRAIHGEDKLRHMPGLLTYGFFRREGDDQPEIRMHPDRFGYVIVSADSRDEALARVEECLRTVTIEVSP
ncbi:MAG: ATP-grasp domain-containing protein [Bacteroidota bacterium]